MIQPDFKVRRHLALALCALAVAAGSAAAVAGPALSGPAADSTAHGQGLQSLYQTVFYVAGAVFAAFEAVMLFFLWKSRSTPGRHAAPELGWSLLPLALFAVLAATSSNLWARLSPSRPKVLSRLTCSSPLLPFAAAQLSRGLDHRGSQSPR